MSVRPATPADVPVLVDLVHELAAYERAPDAVETDEALLAGALFAPEPTVFAHVAEEDGRVQGMAIWYLTYSTWTGRNGIHLEDLFVRPEARGHGFGLALVTELARLTVARGYTRLEWQVLDWNEPALAFYRSLGAAALDEWTGYRLDGEALTALGRAPGAGDGPPLRW